MSKPAHFLTVSSRQRKNQNTGMRSARMHKRSEDSFVKNVGLKLHPCRFRKHAINDYMSNLHKVDIDPDVVEHLMQGLKLILLMKGSDSLFFRTS